MADDRCIHELVKDQCATCTPRGVDLEAWTTSKTNAKSHGRRGIARFTRRCTACDERIEEGDEIVWDDWHSVWVHPECVS